MLLVVLLFACGAARPDAPANMMAPGGELVLYRDRALVRQRFAFDVPPAGYASIRTTLARGVDIDDVHVVERDRFTIRELRVVAAAANEPTAIELVVGAPRAGRHVLHLAYLTDQIRWDAAYTLTTTPSRTHAVMRGAVAIRNASGVALRDIAVEVIDAELDAAIRRASELGATPYVGKAPPSSPAAVPRPVGRVDVVDGETRVELVPSAKPRPLRSVLVYDPIGTAEDRASAAPVRDADLGTGPASRAVLESIEIPRDAATTRGLPEGPVHLLERRADGSLAVLGKAQLFAPSMRAATADTIPLGVAAGVTGHRERREYTYDEFRKRLVEEFVITIDNERPRPVEVIVREHLYRGTNWSIADPIYAQRPVKEGPQQFSMRTMVPPRARSKLLYVVVYTWP